MNRRTPGGRSPFDSTKEIQREIRREIRKGYGDDYTVSHLGDGDADGRSVKHSAR